jgi:hypothetical protein
MQSDRQTSSDLAYSPIAPETCLSPLLSKDPGDLAQIHPDIGWITASLICCIRKSCCSLSWKSAHGLSWSKRFLYF